MTGQVKKGFVQRSRIDIIACILKNASKGSRKTRMIYRCNLSLAQFKTYENCLIAGELLSRDTNETGIENYKTTEKGKEFLKDFARIKKILDTMRV